MRLRTQIMFLAWYVKMNMHILQFTRITAAILDFRGSHELPKDGALPSHGFKFREIYMIQQKTLDDQRFPGSI